ncbi:MAG: rhodanese-like domain-containing protein [candidate division Zixibacteria bacterium]
MWFKAITVISALIFIALIVVGCSKAGYNKTGDLKRIGFEKASEMINSENPPVVVDVRTPEEFNNELGHIPGSRLIPMQITADSISVYEQFKDREILLVCRSGRRSGIVGDELVAAGFQNVYNLEGGMKGWNSNKGQIKRDVR